VRVCLFRHFGRQIKYTKACVRVKEMAGIWTSQFSLDMVTGSNVSEPNTGLRILRYYDGTGFSYHLKNVAPMELSDEIKAFVNRHSFLTLCL
jgi:hypothetical protein